MRLRVKSWDAERRPECLDLLYVFVSGTLVILGHEGGSASRSVPSRLERVNVKRRLTAVRDPQSARPHVALHGWDAVRITVVACCTMQMRRAPSVTG